MVELNFTAEDKAAVEKVGIHYDFTEEKTREIAAKDVRAVEYKEWCSLLQMIYPGTLICSGLYQQRPQPAQGTIFKREWFNEEHTYTALPHMSMVIQSWDLPFVKSEGSAKCACIIMGRAGGNVYIIDVINEKMDFAENVAAFRRITAKYPKARAKVVENKANGPAIVSLLSKEIPGIVPYEPKGGKEERAIAVTPYFEAGNIFLPKSAPWLQDFVEQFVGFPSGKFKDMVDATVQGIDYLMEKPSVTGPPKDIGLTKESYWKR